MYALNYVKAKSVKEAAAFLAKNPEAKVLAGGMTLIPTLKQRLARPTHVVDIGSLAELRGIAAKGGKVVIGAGAKHHEVATSAAVRKAIPALAGLAAEIGDPQVRNRGTIGGSLANNDPAADYPAAVLGLGATVITNAREIGPDDFFTGLFSTALRPDEIITAVRFPVPDQASYVKFKQPASHFALVGVFVARFGKDVRVAVTGAGLSVFRVAALEQALAKRFAPESCDGVQVPADGLNTDIHASADYRAHLIPLLARRAVQQAIA